MRNQPRVNYDQIAPLYDSQPSRQKAVDPELERFVAQQHRADSLLVLDLGCGTGNQLVANHAAFPTARMIGADRFRSMLRQGQSKTSDIRWVQGDSAYPPFRPLSFDFITCQFSFHHVEDKGVMLKSVLDLLRPEGRFVLTNICPQEMDDWLIYRYFPAARALDLQDFWAPATIEQVMREEGFQAVQVELSHFHHEQDMRVFLDRVHRRDICSQLIAISDESYTTGVDQLERELLNTPELYMQPDHACILTIRGDRLA